MRICINSPFDIHAEGEIAFRCSCENGHLLIVKYLINYANLINSPINIKKHLSQDQIIILKKIQLKLLFLQLKKSLKTVQLQYVIREKIYNPF